MFGCCFFNGLVLNFPVVLTTLFFFLFAIFFFQLDCDLTLFYFDKYKNHSVKLANKVVWITGASSGIGEQLAYELATCKCQLALSGTNLVRLQAVKIRCISLGLSEDDVFLLPFNMCHHEEHLDRLNDVLNHFGKLDILVNNAGRSQRANFLDIDLEVDREAMELNVFAPINLTRHALRYFLRSDREGHFVVTSSCVGKYGVPGSASYTGSKHALHGYFEGLRTEMARSKISVTMCCPGPVFSKFLENAFTDSPGSKYGGETKSSDHRMATDRCARLMAVSIAYKLDEAWIALQPCLLLYYLAQYTPTFFRKILIEKFYTPERANKFREGRW